MKYSTLGSSGLKVSRVCLGSMTWGVQNDQADADAQLDYAIGQGVNFIDTAEMYAIPPSAETYGSTETILGNWLAKQSAQRAELVVATKITGPGCPWIREGAPISGQSVEQAVDASLQRLQTDYIDVYQLHWPNHPNTHFSRHWPNSVKFTGRDTQRDVDAMLDILRGLARCVEAGKIRHCGLSDDSPWGMAKYLELAKAHSLPRITSIQNEFSLLHSKDVPHLLEYCVREDIAYLPWSPLAGGILSAKYAGGARPSGSRWTFDQRQGLFRDTEAVHAATRAYSDLAKKYDRTTAQLALAWCDNVDGVTSTIIGATTMAQLQENIAAFELPFDDAISEDIASALKRHAFPF
ncbi:MAG: aldo/keto reductase [Gammaproteobacteria bacterium]|nr:aldo/keto reductase [Gammaproteobacteria bacterium]MBT8150024.1 aldo/keto reductase [Gammaproteobacteria bacterium]NND38555.1 aldo/keto reductase [Pseudomonadales bacterium]NNM10854.1 aldo/keto reductase [Pseudomonadales bacterium]